MKSLPFLFTAAIAGAMLVGCGQQEQGTDTARTSTDTHTHADGSTHGAHDNADSSHSHGHSHGGTVVALGEKQVLGYTVSAKLEGTVEAGKEAVFLIETSAAADAVRLWVGDEQATNTDKAKAEGGPTSFHAHTMVSSPMADGAQLWVEVQNAAGERAAAAFDLNNSSETAIHSHDGEAHSHGEDVPHSHEESSATTTHTHGDGTSHSH